MLLGWHSFVATAAHGLAVNKPSSDVATRVQTTFRVTVYHTVNHVRFGMFSIIFFSRSTV